MSLRNSINSHKCIIKAREREDIRQHISIVIPSYISSLSIATDTLSKVYFDFITRESQSHILNTRGDREYIFCVVYEKRKKNIAIKVRSERKKS